MTAMSLARSEVAIFSTTRDWVFFALASVIAARLTGVEVIVNFSGMGNEWRYSKRRRILEQLGCSVAVGVRIDAGLLCAVAVDRVAIGEAEAAKAIVTRPSAPSQGSQAASLERLDDLLRRHLTRKRWNEPARLRMSEVQAPDLEAALRRVPLYATAQVSIADVEIEELMVSQKFVRSYKLTQARALLECFRNAGLAPFVPAKVSTGNGPGRLLVPPVVESLDGSYILIEGHSRLLALHENGCKETQVAVVSGVRLKPPAVTRAWRELEEAGLARWLRESLQIDQRDENLSRRIEYWIHT